MVVTEIPPSDTYRISQLEPSNGRPYATIAHVSQLKAWRSWNEDDDDSSTNSDNGPEMQRSKRTGRLGLVGHRGTLGQSLYFKYFPIDSAVTPAKYVSSVITPPFFPVKVIEEAATTKELAGIFKFLPRKFAKSANKKVSQPTAKEKERKKERKRKGRKKERKRKGRKDHTDLQMNVKA
ncbi:hypothetical protein AVEN_83607-1 [Araneus ventricosus]|uniref:Uncharacterized protein n=1 Tax=Araneus ventricosus TaxID=182803 RepID=A0A4Y2G0Y7_ARAVE|nr:hypothetical protein AVEN_83607-1 [Araneus ventricosus]